LLVLGNVYSVVSLPIFWNITLRTALLVLAGILRRYGFADWQSNLAVQICGSDVEQCLDWLLRNGSSMQTDMTVHSEKKMVRIIRSIFVCEYGRCPTSSFKLLTNRVIKALDRSVLQVEDVAGNNLELYKV